MTRLITTPESWERVSRRLPSQIEGVLVGGQLARSRTGRFYPMKLVTFDPLRTWDIPGAVALKAHEWQRHLPLLHQADWVLFPEYWQVDFLTYALHRRIFPSISTYHLGFTKVDMTYAFQAAFPVHVPHTRILSRTDSALEQILDEFYFPFVVKKVRSSMGRGVDLIENRADLEAYVAANSTLYVQEYLPIDRDLRVAVVGREIVAAYWRIAPMGGFHNNLSRGGTVLFDDIPDAALDLVREVAATLNIDHGGFDVAMVDGHPYLFEFNMRFGNDALRQQRIRLGAPILHYLRERHAAEQSVVAALQP